MIGFKEKKKEEKAIIQIERKSYTESIKFTIKMFCKQLMW